VSYGSSWTTTLGRHTGKRIAAASMHRDPLLSTNRRMFFHWGHVWVVLAIEVTLFDKSWALPVLFRLHRSEKRCKAEKRPYSKLTEDARELIELLVARYPSRRFELLGDAAYTNGTLIKRRPANVTLIGRGRLDAALYAPAAPASPWPDGAHSRSRQARCFAGSTRKASKRTMEEIDGLRLRSYGDCSRPRHRRPLVCRRRQRHRSSRRRARLPRPRARRCLRLDRPDAFGSCHHRIIR